MKVLAIDPGYGRCGIAVLEREGHTDTLLYSVCIETPADMDFAERLGTVAKEVRGLAQKHHPNALAMEKLFLGKNKKTAMRVAEVRGAILAVAADAELPVFEYAPSEIKSAATGSGSADKEQVIKMLHALVKIDARNRLDDEYDAIAVGVTHLASYRMRAARTLHSEPKQS